MLECVLGILIVISLSAALAYRSFRRSSGKLRPRLWFWRNLTELYCRLCFRLRADGVEHVPREGPLIITSNHTVSIDPLLIISCIRDRVPAYMIAREFYNIPVFGRLTKMIGCIPVNRSGEDTAATRAALRHLRQGKSLGIFIQGRINRPGEVLPPKQGVAVLALRTGAKVVPAYICGTKYTAGVTPGFFRLHRARVRFGAPVDVLALTGGAADRQAVEFVTKTLFERIYTLGLDSRASNSTSC